MRKTIIEGQDKKLHNVAESKTPPTQTTHAGWSKGVHTSEMNVGVEQGGIHDWCKGESVTRESSHILVVSLVPGLTGRVVKRSNAIGTTEIC